MEHELRVEGEVLLEAVRGGVVRDEVAELLADANQHPAKGRNTRRLGEINIICIDKIFKIS